jgi:hypothetical protein
MFRENDVEKKKHIFCSVYFFFRKSYRLWDHVGKYRRAEQTTSDNMRYAHCMLDTEDYKHTLRICNTYYCYTPTMVKRTRLNVTLYVHCLSCVSFLPVNRKYYSHVK